MQWATALEAANKAGWERGWAHQLKEKAASHNDEKTITTTAELHAWRGPWIIQNDAVKHFNESRAAYDHYKAIEKAEQQAYLDTLAIEGLGAFTWTGPQLGATDLSNFKFDATHYPGSNDEFKTILRRLSASIDAKVATRD